MSNEIVSAKSLFQRQDVKSKINELLGQRSTAFITSVLQIVSQNELLAKADPGSVYHAAVVAATLDLPLNNNLGFAYIVPYNQSFKEGNTWVKKQVAQFQMGYKGFIQLAQRSGQFKTIAAAPIYEGQLVSENPLEGYEFDFTQRVSDKIIGFASYFKLLNGFEKTLYMTVEQIRAHAKRYSQTYGNEKGRWNVDFDAMALKTVIKLLLSKYAPLSVEMQRAVVMDQAVVKDAETMDVEYADNEPVQISPESARLIAMIGDCTTMEQLMKIKESIPEADEAAMQAYENKFEELNK